MADISSIPGQPSLIDPSIYKSNPNSFEHTMDNIGHDDWDPFPQLSSSSHAESHLDQQRATPGPPSKHDELISDSPSQLPRPSTPRINHPNSSDETSTQNISTHTNLRSQIFTSNSAFEEQSDRSTSTSRLPQRSNSTSARNAPSEATASRNPNSLAVQVDSVPRTSQMATARDRPGTSRDPEALRDLALLGNNYSTPDDNLDPRLRLEATVDDQFVQVRRSPTIQPIIPTSTVVSWLVCYQSNALKY